MAEPEPPHVDPFELFAGPAQLFRVGRRDFCRLMGSGLLVAFGTGPARLSRPAPRA